MFQLIVAIFSIAIIACLAIASIFLGAQSFNASAEGRAYAERNSWEAPAKSRTSKERSWSSSGEIY